MRKILKYAFVFLLFCSFALVGCDNSSDNGDEPSQGVTPPKDINYEISLDQNSLELEVGEEITLVATLLADGNKCNDTVTWSTSNPNVATVIEGTVKGISDGTAVVTVSAHNVSATAEITVVETETFLVLSANVMNMKIGDTNQLEAWTTNGPAQNLTYVSSVPSVATVSETGLITGLSEGNTVITVTDGAGLTATCSVNVTGNYELIFPEIENNDVFIGDVIDLNVVVKVNGEDIDAVFEVLGSGFTADGDVITITSDGEITVTVKYDVIEFSQTITSWNKITTVNEFLSIKNDLDGYFMLMNDLDFKGATVEAFSSYKTYNSTSSKGFTGIFDGQ